MSDTSPPPAESADSALLPLSAAPCGLASALEARGFESLTTIQSAVIDAQAKGRDLRLTSQTGSGKTVAVGLAMAEEVAEAENHRGIARPTALVIAPTRELAAQLARELTWLYAPLKKSVTVVTGGTSLLAEKRQLKKGPHVLVGTPGRLLDHLRHDAISLENLRVVVLDEADEMLDMGFEEELNGILDFAPEERQTHLVSATFGRLALKLAAKLQKDPLAVEGTPLGAANADIEHRCIMAHPSGRLDVVVNLLLRFLGEKTLIFVRTRASTMELARNLSDLGFSALPLSGEMTQRERTDAFDRFRRGHIKVLVATDVAARGVDVQDISLVIQADLPDDAEVLTHRSGRTGRAGRTGRNILLMSPRARRRAEALMRQARIRAKFVDAPDAASIRAAADARLLSTVQQEVQATTAVLAAMRQSEEAGDETGEPTPAERENERLRTLASQILVDADPEAVVATLLARIGHDGPTPPRELDRPRKADRARKNDRGERKERGRGRDRDNDDGPPRRNDGNYVAFQVSWGGENGADPRRLLALVCRRGGVSRQDIGAIRVGPRSSMVEVIEEQVGAFEKAVSRPDHRDRHVHFRRWNGPSGGGSRSPGAPGRKGGFRKGGFGKGGFNKGKGKGKPPRR